MSNQLYMWLPVSVKAFLATLDEGRKLYREALTMPTARERREREILARLTEIADILKRLERRV